MRIIEISEDKFEKMGELTEKMLKYGGRLMSCISELGDEYGISFRDGGMNYRDEDEEYGRSMMGGHRGYGMRGGMNYRDEDWDDEINERRGRRHRDSMGRYR